MPTYEYRCANGHAFEQFQKISDPPIEACPECGAPSERVLSGGAGLLFKGSGFYITDYRSDTYRKAAASEGSGSEAGGAGTDGKAGGDGGKGKSTSGGTASGGTTASGGSAAG